MKKLTIILFILVLLSNFTATSQSINCNDTITKLQERINYLELRSPENKPSYSSKKATYELQFSDAKFIAPNKYEINLLIKNTGEDRLIYIVPKNLDFIDGEGNGYNCVDAKLGKDVLKYNSYWGQCVTSTLYSNILTKLTLTFDATKKIDIISLCSVELIIEKQALDAPRIVFKLSNIPVN